MDMSPQPVDAFQESWRIQAAASDLGFDWPSVEGVLAKMEEEIAEIRAALQEHDQEHAGRELGDLLLAAVNAARFLKTDPCKELYDATQRFSARFELVKKHFDDAGISMKSCALDELEQVWQQVHFYGSFA